MGLNPAEARLEIELLVPAPSDDRDPALFDVLVRWHLWDPVSPDDVHVPAEGVHGAVGLGHRNDRPSNDKTILRNYESLRIPFLWIKRKFKECCVLNIHFRRSRRKLPYSNDTFYLIYG